MRYVVASSEVPKRLWRDICLSVAVLAFLALPTAYGQFTGFPYHDSVLNDEGRAIPYATIRVCGFPVTGPPPCTPLASIYGDQNLTQQLPNPITADIHGRYVFFASAGFYTLEISAPSVPVYDVPIWVGSGGGGGTNAGIQVNGTPTTNSGSTVIGNFNGTTPAPPSGSVNAIFQADALNPSHVSAYVPSVGPFVALPQNTFACGSGNTSVQQNQLVCTLALVALTQGQTAVGPFAPQPADVIHAGPIIPPGAGAGIRQAAECDAFAGSNGGSCTLTLPSPNHGDTNHPIIIVWCASTQQVCSGSSGSLTDTDGNTWSGLFAMGASGMVYQMAANPKIGTARDSITCTGPGGIQTGNFECIAQELNNFTAVDATGGKGIGPVGATYETVSASVTTTHANDLIIIFATQGTDWPCSGSQVFLSPMGFVAGRLAANPGIGLDGPVYLSANVIGAAVAGTYNAFMTTANIAGGAGCGTISAGAQSTLGLLALQPSSATAPAEPPTWRYVNCVDLGYGLGTGNTIPSCAANDVAIATNPGSSSIASTALIPASAIGQIQRVSFYLYQVGAGNGCTGNAGVTATFSWTDLNSTAQSVTSASVSMGNALGAGDFLQNQYMVSAKSGTTLNYSTTFTNGTGCTTQPTYQLLMRATWGGQ